MSFPLAVVVDPDMMAQVTSPAANLLKYWGNVWHAFKPFTNDEDLVHLEGQKWKEARAMFNPGFSQKNLMSLLPQFLEEALVFREKLRSFANTGQVVELEPLVASLTVDVMSRAVL